MTAANGSPATRKRIIGYLVALCYVAVVVLANVLSSRYGLVSVGFGLIASAGTYCAGAALIFRDVVQRQLGRVWSVVIIVIGSALSFLLADPFIAGASLAAFAISETVDFLIYTPLRRKGFAVAALASVLVAGLVDTYVFLKVAGFPISGSVIAGQMIGKGYALVAVLAVTLTLQVRSREVVAA